MTTLTYDIRWSPQTPAAAGRQAWLRFTYQDPETGHRQDGVATLDAANPVYRWKLEVPDGTAGTALYAGVLAGAGEEAVPIPPQPLAPRTALDPGSSAAPESDGEIAFGLLVFYAEEGDFATVQAIEVAYDDAGPRSFRLTAAEPFRILVAGLDYPPGEPLAYSLRYSVAEGSYRRFGLTASTVFNRLPYPFVSCRAEFASVGIEGPDPSVRTVQLQYQNVEDGAGWKIESPLCRTSLDADLPDLAWSFLAVDPSFARVSYSGTVVMRSGQQVPIPPTQTTIKEIPVGDTPGVQSVEVTAGAVHWDLYATVLVSIWTAGDRGSRKNLGEHVFEPGTPPWYWSYIGPRADYLWQAVYYPRAGGSKETRVKTGFAPVLTLPSEV
jgi:hypothetical protein